MLLIGIGLGIGGLVIGSWFVGTYNGFKSGKVSIQTQFSNIKAEYQRRCDLFVNLVETVKSFKKHEKGTLSEVISARGGKYWNVPKGEAIQKMKGLEAIFSKLLMVKENYPELKANKQHEMLMEEIRLTEDRVNVARTDYNEIVRYYNNMVVTVPSSFVASMFKFRQESFFELITEGAENTPKIDLGE